MASIHNPQTINLKRFDWLLKSLIIRKQSRWFYQLKGSKHYSELDLQRAIIHKLKEILPEYYIIYYEKFIHSSTIKNLKKKPDFLMWKKDYSEWFVIEVELENHLTSHIEAQLSVFYDGDYSDVNAIATYICKYETSADKNKLISLISSRSPQIMLIADSIHCNWVSDFSKYNCLFCTLQLYGDESENYLYRLSGDFPQVYSSFSYCDLDKRLRAINISSLNFLQNLKHQNGDKILVYYQNVGAHWEIISNKGAETLIYLGDYLPLDSTHKRWKLILNKKNQLHIIKS